MRFHTIGGVDAALLCAGTTTEKFSFLTEKRFETRVAEDARRVAARGFVNLSGEVGHATVGTEFLADAVAGIAMLKTTLKVCSSYRGQTPHLART